MKMTRSTALCVAVIAAIGAVPAASAMKLPARAKYVGKTSQGASVQLRLSHDAKRIARMRIHYKLRCDNKSTVETYTVINNPRVRAKRHFGAAGTYTGTSDKSKNKFKVTGTLTRRRAHGTFSLNSVVKRADGRRVHCQTGDVRWHARRVK
jgi:hypothetical protein